MQMKSPRQSLTGSLGMDLRGGSTAPLATSENSLEVAHAEARAVVQAAANSGCMFQDSGS